MSAAEWGMDALVEIHDLVELDRALGLNAKFVRHQQPQSEDLSRRVSKPPSTLRPACRTMCCCSPKAALSTTTISSGLEKEAGIGTFLVGESLMRNDNVLAATRMLLTGKV